MDRHSLFHVLTGVLWLALAVPAPVAAEQLEYPGDPLDQGAPSGLVRGAVRGTGSTASRTEDTLPEFGSYHFAIRLESGGDERDVRDLARQLLEAGYDRAVEVTAVHPRWPIRVVVYSTREAYESAGGRSWAPGFYDRTHGAIRVCLSVCARQEGALTVVSTMAHEVTHLIVDEVTHRAAPWWLTEGLAQVSGRTAVDEAHRTTRAYLEWAPSGELPSLKDLGLSTLPRNMSRAQAYAMALSATAYLIAQRGMRDMDAVLAKLGRGTSPEAALGRDYPALQKDWVEWLKTTTLPGAR